MHERTSSYIIKHFMHTIWDLNKLAQTSKQNDKEFNLIAYKMFMTLDFKGVA